MPYSFVLPTTSHLPFQAFLISPTHPSLPLAISTTRSHLRSLLKAHKALSPSRQTADLPRILRAIEEYIPYLCTVDAGLSGKKVADECVEINLLQEFEVEWRSPLLGNSIRARNQARIKGRGFDYEVFSVLQTLARVHYLLARASLLQSYTNTTNPSASSPGPLFGTTVIQTSTKHLLTSHAIHGHLIHRTHHAGDSPPTFPQQAVDIRLGTQCSLAELTLAEATLLFVLKDDPYPALIQQLRDDDDKEWMVKAPTVPAVRAHLFARLCFGAADHAAKASAAIAGANAQGLTKDLPTYCEDLRRVARARGCRFLALDAEAAGRTGEAIAWLRSGYLELGIVIPDNDELSTTGSKSNSKKRTGLDKLKSAFAEKRSNRRLEKGGTKEWGNDAGRAEEIRILDWLYTKYSIENDLVNVQLVPDSVVQAATKTPSGREAFGANHHPELYWKSKTLDEGQLAKMRAPVEEENNGDGGMIGDDDSSSGDEVDEQIHQGLSSINQGRPPGAFPGLGLEGAGTGDYY